MRRNTALSILAVTVLAASCVAGRQHDEHLWANSQRVRPGMSAAQAEQILGSPSWQNGCGAKFPYGWQQNCVAELGYRSAFAPLLPAYLIVQLDNRSRVISVDTIQSP
jgi:hypothetical protein